MIRKLTALIYWFVVVFAAVVHADKKPELALPITEKKRVIAHFMPAAVFFKGGRVPDNCNPAYASPDGAAAKIGGLVQAVPMSGVLRPDVSLDEAVEHEIRAAKLAGLDGFQFFYPFAGRILLKRYNRTIAAFYRVAEEKFPDFRLTLCFCCSECDLEESKAIARWSESINELLDECRESPVWLKTPDGRYLFYTWCPDGLVGSIARHHKVFQKPELISETARVYRELADACGIRAAYIYHLRQHDKKKVLEAALDNFSAVWGWTDSFSDDDGWEPVEKECRRRNRTCTQTIYPDYYTSKLYNLDTHKMIHHLNDALDLPVEKLGRETQNCGLTYVYRNLLERAVKLDAPLINLATWNDFGEGHHLAPEINHNFAFGVLLNHYKRQWMGKPAEAPVSREYRE